MSERRALRTGPGAQGLTLLEILVVLACASLILGVAYQFWTTATRYSRNLQGRFELLSRTQLTITRLHRELASSRRILYPAPGRTASGLGVINGNGQAVVYRLDREASPQRLLRHETGTDPSILQEGILDCQFKVPVTPAGRDPGLVHLTLSLSGPGGRSVPVFTSMRLRPLDMRCPVYR